MRGIIGIDPGRTGAIAWMQEGKLMRVEDLPQIELVISGKKRSKQNPSQIRDWLADPTSPYTPVYLEEVHAMPKEGAVGAFSFGRGFGQIEGILAALQIPYVLVKPAKWKLAMGVPADKGQARARAIREFPAMAHLFARVKDDGRAEAALIALYGSRQP